MWILLPYEVDVRMKQRPVANYWLLGLIAAISLICLRWDGIVADLVLTEPLSLGVVGHMFVHAGALHLLGNLIFLWVFGNAVCAKLGNGPYGVLFLVFGVVAAWGHLALDGAPAVGASGAINGVIGVFAVLFPLNATRCVWVFFFRGGTVAIRSVWLISIWLALDLLGAFSGAGNTAYVAHLAGLASGVVFGVIVVKRCWITMEPYERSLLDVLEDRMGGYAARFRRGRPG